MSQKHPEPKTGTVLINALLRNDGAHELNTTMAFATYVMEQMPQHASQMSVAVSDILYVRGRKIIDEAFQAVFNGKDSGFNMSPSGHIADQSPMAPYARVEWLIADGDEPYNLTCQIIPLNGAKRQKLPVWNSAIGRALVDLAYATRSREVEGQIGDTVPEPGSSD